MNEKIEEKMLNIINFERNKYKINSLIVNNLFKKSLLDFYQYYKFNENNLSKTELKEKLNLNFCEYNDFELIISIKENQNNFNYEYIVDLNKNYIWNKEFNQICIISLIDDNNSNIYILLIKNIILIEELKISHEIRIKGKIFNNNYKIKHIMINNKFKIKTKENNLIGGNFLFLENNYKNIIWTNTNFKIEIFLEFLQKNIIFKLLIQNKNYSDILYNHNQYNFKFINGINNSNRYEQDNIFNNKDSKSIINNNLNFSKFELKNNESNLITTNFDANNKLNNKLDISSIKFESFTNQDNFTNNKKHTIKLGKNKNIIKNIDNSYTSITENRKFLNIDESLISDDIENIYKKKSNSIKAELRININYDNYISYNNYIFNSLLYKIKDKNILEKIRKYINNIIKNGENKTEEFEVLIYNLFQDNIKNKRESIVKNFEFCYNDNDNSDFIFVVNKKIFYVHSFVLTFQSKFFENLFEINKMSKKGKPQNNNYNYNKFLLNNNKNDNDNNKNNRIKNETLDFNSDNIDSDILKINNLKFNYKISKIILPKNFNEFHFEILKNFLYKNTINFNFDNIELEQLLPLLNAAILFNLKELISELSYHLLTKINNDNIFNILDIILKGFKNDNLNNYQYIIILISLISLALNLKYLLETKNYDINIKNKLIDIFSIIKIEYLIEFIEFYTILHKRITDYENEFFISLLMIGYNTLNISEILKKYINNDDSIISFDTRSFNSINLNNLLINNKDCYYINSNFIFKETDLNYFSKKIDNSKLNLSNINSKQPFIELELSFINNYDILATEVINFYQGGLRFFFQKNENNILNLYFLLSENNKENLIIENLNGNLFGSFNIYIEIYDKVKNLQPLKGIQFWVTLQKNSNLLFGKNNFFKLNNNQKYIIKIYIKEDFILNNFIGFLSFNLDKYINYYISADKEVENDYMSFINEDEKISKIKNELLKNDHFEIKNEYFDYFNINPYSLFTILSSDNLVTNEEIILLFIVNILLNNDYNTDYDIIISSLRYNFIELKILLIACIKHKFLLENNNLKNFIKEKLQNMDNINQNIFYYNKNRKNDNKIYNNIDDIFNNLISFLKEYNENEIINLNNEKIEKLKIEKEKEIQYYKDINYEKDRQIRNYKEENIKYKSIVQNMYQNDVIKNEDKYHTKSKNKNIYYSNKSIKEENKKKANKNYIFDFIKGFLPNFN